VAEKTLRGTRTGNPNDRLPGSTHDRLHVEEHERLSNPTRHRAAYPDPIDSLGARYRTLCDGIIAASNVKAREVAPTFIRTRSLQPST
jgi:hypothetical protein